MKTIKNKPYESPQLTAVTFKVEEGFAVSGDTRLFFTFQTVNDEYEETTFGRKTYGDAAEQSNTAGTWF